MKNITTLIAFSIIQSISFGQVEFSLPAGLIYDLPGNTFLLANGLNGQIFISELDSLANVLWQDSIPFTNSGSISGLNGITHFKGTDEYLLTSYILDTMLQVPMDTATYQFSKFSISSQSFTNSVSKSFVTNISNGKSMKSMSLKDSTVLMFNITTPYSYRIETIEVNTNLEFSYLAPPDSMWVPEVVFSFYPIANKFYTLKSSDNYGSYKLDKYSDSVSLLNSYSYLLDNGNSSVRVNNFDFISDDSIFIHQLGTSGGYDRYWSFAFLDSNLNELSSSYFLSPVGDSSSFHYLSYNSTLISNGYIYLLGATSYSPNGEEKIFIYDYNFNLICSIPLNLTTYGYDLKMLNNKPYLTYYNSNTGITDYYLINICSPITSINEDIIDLNVLVYPNPTNNNVKINIGNASEMDILVFDMLGKVKISTHTNTKITEINLENFSKGVYFIKIGNKYNAITKKIIRN